MYKPENIQRLVPQVLMVCFSAMLLLACGKRRQNDAHFFKYNEVSGISSLDPAFAKSQSVIWATHQLYSTLVETDEQLHIVPSVAKSWDISTDRLQITFHLRNDVFFHDNAAFANGKGRRVVAADVVYSFQRLIDKATASPGAWIFNNRIDTLKGFEALDDTTFRINLQKPFVQILGVLSNVYCSIVPKEVVEKYGVDFRRNPCGSGPFQFKAWEEGQALILERNPNYFETDSTGKRLPYVDGVKVSFLDSKASEFMEFRQGNLHFINDIDASFKDEVLSKKGELRDSWKGKVVLNKHPYLNIEYIGILVDSSNSLVNNSPLKLKAIRQAINYGFDRRKMMLYLRNSIGTAAESGFVPTGLPSFDSAVVKGYSYNPQKAKALLKEAGFGNGKQVPEIKLLTIPIYADLGSYIARQLQDIGLNVKVEAVQKSLLLTQTAKSEALFFRGSWIADYPDAENYLSVFYGKNPAPPNYTRYKNPLFDVLYERSTKEPNDSIRYSLYQQMDQLIVQDAPVVPLWYDMVIHLVQPNVKGFRPNALNWLELRRVKIM
ncbi:peptide/nickel transport system substrate-binding protein [Lacibacter cauensis]|uniref:Peptide/nickel transport system substrate-binding protein n=1 Tax=Lacibacter cauensis TaxID=510947 RepID=A0A562SHF1_9BACT|nr:ABC transporter substrate-binding protein [Lacibacter cauensis]TWI80689.1 peptide/nickel transport system substrate-binding protein [Lacibacter cauensis]